MLRNSFSRSHARETIQLAWPLVITQVGHIITGMVDNIFLGMIGPTEQAAGILSNNLYMLLLVFGIGMSYATTPLVTEAQEQGRLLRKASLLKNSLFLNLGVAVCCFLILFQLSDLLQYMRQPLDVVMLAVPFFDVIIFSMIPVSVFFACKQYCEGVSNTRMALFISISGNILNIILNYCFIYGKMGLPELGYLGAAWATFCARVFMGVSFLVLVFRSPVTKEIAAVWNRTKINWKELRELWKIGINSAMQFTFEVAAFAIAGLMAGSFGKEQIDAHGVALSLAAFTYMFGSGIASAATIRAGVCKAQGSWEEIRKSAGTAIMLVWIVMGSFGIIFLAFHDILPLVFSREKMILHLASQLLVIAAMFQLFDGMQVVIIGILRGLGDVRTPTIITLTGYWVLAIPLSYFLAFSCALETWGIWIALAAALAFVGLSLYWRLNYLVNKQI
jgi:MATE family multidrug resistance protein